MAKKPKEQSVAHKLQAAIKFCSVASRDIGLAYQSHYMFVNKHMVATDGIISAAFPVDEDLNCCPHAKMFATAINHATTDLAMTESPDRDRLSIKAGKLTTTIPCIYAVEYPIFGPDQPQGPLGEAFRTALKAVGVLATEAADRVLCASVLIRANTVLGTDTHSIFEAWHGWNLPTLALPKGFVTALEKTDLVITQFGFSDASFTVYFENGAWMKTQLMDVKEWERVDSIMSTFPNEYHPLPDDFHEGVALLLKQSADGDHSIDICNDYMETVDGNAKYEIYLACGEFIRCNSKFLAKVQWATKWNAPTRLQLFFAGALPIPTRGTIVCIRPPDIKTENIPKHLGAPKFQVDDDVPMYDGAKEMRLADLRSRPFHTLTRDEKDELIPF